MFAFLLGLAWLILTPVCVWLLFSRDRSGAVRAAAVVTLGALQVRTTVIGFADRHPVTPSAAPASSPAAAPPVAVAAPDGANGSVAASGADAPPCPARILSPEAVRLRRSGGSLNVTVFWKAGTPPCEEAAVALRPSGKRLGILLRAGDAGEHPAGARGEMRTAPVRVTRGVASLQLRFTPRRHQHRRYVAVNVHTGHRIPDARPGQYR